MKKPSKERLDELIKNHDELEKKIAKKLEKLPNSGKVCDCDIPEIFYKVFLGGEFDEITMTYTCTKCGGYVEKGDLYK